MKYCTFYLLMAGCIPNILLAQYSGKELLFEASAQLNDLNFVNYGIESTLKHRSKSETHYYEASVFYNRKINEFQLTSSDSIYGLCRDSILILQIRDTLAFVYDISLKDDFQNTLRQFIPDFLKTPEYLLTFLEEPWLFSDSSCDDPGKRCFSFLRPSEFDSTTFTFFRAEINLVIDTLSLLPIYYSQTLWTDSTADVYSASIEYLDFNDSARAVIPDGILLNDRVIVKHISPAAPLSKEPLPTIILGLHYVAVNGDTIQLADSHKNLVLLDFWFVGCGMCELAERHLTLIESEYGEKVQVLRLNPIDTSWLRISNKMHKSGITENYGIISKAYVLEQLRIYGYPTLILLDEKNRVIYRSDGFSFDEMKKLKAIIAEK
ncbi:MAG: TlpA family protein disulfide reductase [Bacteroidia bacterium]